MAGQGLEQEGEEEPKMGLLEEDEWTLKRLKKGKDIEKLRRRHRLLLCSAMGKWKGRSRRCCRRRSNEGRCFDAGGWFIFDGGRSNGHWSGARDGKGLDLQLWRAAAGGNANLLHLGYLEAGMSLDQRGDVKFGVIGSDQRMLYEIFKNSMVGKSKHHSINTVWPNGSDKGISCSSSLKHIGKFGQILIRCKPNDILKKTWSLYHPVEVGLALHVSSLNQQFVPFLWTCWLPKKRVRRKEDKDNNKFWLH
jgi:hypothetical protein